MTLYHSNRTLENIRDTLIAHKNYTNRTFIWIRGILETLIYRSRVSFEKTTPKVKNA